MAGRKISWTKAAVSACVLFQILNALSILLLLMAAFRVLIDPASINASSGEPVSVCFFGANFSLNGMSLYSTDGAATVPGVIIYMLMGCALSAMRFLAFGNIRRVIDFSGSPFCRESVEKLRSAGELFLGTVALQVAYCLITMFFAFGSLSLNVNLKFDDIVIGVILLCTSEIFQRGAQMQEEQDGLV